MPRAAIYALFRRAAVSWHVLVVLVVVTSMVAGVAIAASSTVGVVIDGIAPDEAHNGTVDSDRLVPGSSVPSSSGGGANASARSVVVTVRVYDPDRLPAPNELEAVGAVESIDLMWQPVERDDCAAYTLYRGLSANGPFEPIVTVPHGTTDFEDAEIDPRVLYHYWVVARRADDRRGSRSNVASAMVSPNVERLWGENRVGTAVDVSRNTFESADTVVICTSQHFADALAASGLAGSHQAPILLTSPTALSQPTREEIERLGASRAVIVGGPIAVSDNVRHALEGMGLSVSRFGGANRYETSVRIAAEIKRNETQLGRPFSSQAFLVRGDTFPDALSVSPLAYSLKAPVLLTTPNRLPDSVRHYLMAERFARQFVAGGVNAISERVASDAAQAGSSTSVRRGGQNRYETSSQIAEYGASEGWVGWSAVGIATGTNFPDALTGGAAIGEMGGVLLVTTPGGLHASTEISMTLHRHEIFQARLFGGVRALSENVANQVRQLIE